MAEIKFGRSQLKNPTPAIWAKPVQVFTVLGGVALGWLGSTTMFGIHTTSNIQSVLGLLIGMANGLLPFLGVSTSGEDVPVEKVTEMETKTN